MSTTHPTLYFKTPSGEIHQVEYRQFTLNSRQQFVVLAINREEHPIETEGVAGLEYDFIGKLQEQSFIFQSQIENSLLRDHWDFEQWPNPEILLITVQITDGYFIGNENGDGYIFCSRCGRKSFNQNDIDNRYCSACNVFHKEP